MHCQWYPFVGETAGNGPTFRRGAQIMRYLHDRAIRKSGGPEHVFVVDTENVSPVQMLDIILDPRDALGLERGRCGSFLFLVPQRTPDRAHGEVTAVSKCTFLIQLFRKYGIAQIVPSFEGLEVNGAVTDQHEADLAWVEHWIARKEQGFPDLISRIDAIREDARRLLHLAALEIPVGSALFPQIPFLAGTSNDLREFLQTLSILSQQVTSGASVVEAELKAGVGWLGGTGFSLERELARLLRSPGENSETTVRLLSERMRCALLLSDLADWLSSGAFRFTREFELLPIHILVVDELNFHGNVADASGAHLAKDVLERLRRIENAFRLDGPDHASAVAFYRLVEGDVWKSLTEHMRHGTGLDACRIGDGANATASDPLRNTYFGYDVVLVEPELRSRRIGPIMVERLAQYFEGLKTIAGLDYRPPVIIVMSQSDNHVDVQQCLNLGAHAYVRKEHLYELPGQVARARIAHRAPEPRARKSNFSSLYALPPQQIAELQNRRRADMILGTQLEMQAPGQELSGADVPEKRRVPDPIDRHWLHLLPKADLHSHIGTFIDLPTIEAMALNTVGYVFERWREPGVDQGTPMVEAGISAVLARTCVLVEVAGRMRVAARKIHRDLEPADAFQWAKDWIEPGSAQGRTPDKVYEEIIDWLWREDRQLARFEVASLLVAYICLIGGIGIARATGDLLPQRALTRWQYLLELQSWDNTLNAPRELRAEEWNAWSGGAEDLDVQGQPDPEWQRPILAKAKKVMLRIDENWRRVTTSNPPERESVLPIGRSPFWKDRHNRVDKRVRLATQGLQEYRKKSFETATIESIVDLTARAHSERRRVFESLNRRGVCELIEPMVRRRMHESMRDTLTTGSAGGQETDGTRPDDAEASVPSLREFVTIPTNPAPSEQTLLRYLRGASLLGADHLQYPENILVAAESIVAQSVEENVWYAELRCETTGYAAGGMSVPDSTDLLCCALTLAECVVARRFRWERWARVNVLLGAKRHKSEELFRACVALLAHYLQRGKPKKVPFLGAPSWWEPSRVIGFDLSGDESKGFANPAELMKPLLAQSAPISIHAGEAATAESIWGAVYQFGARRIGHGLRLREDRRLMDYCVNEGICLELCPISNRYTNGFKAATGDRVYYPHWREHYPLRYYLEQGLDVCVCTDNRQLHGGKTLTDEYMCAAELVGGLTRWEVLRLVKAGFKRAFLPKREVEKMLSAVEDRVYYLVTHRRIHESDATLTAGPSSVRPRLSRNTEADGGASEIAEK